jgi:hypothetical protein
VVANNKMKMGKHDKCGARAAGGEFGFDGASQGPKILSLPPSSSIPGYASSIVRLHRLREARPCRGLALPDHCGLHAREIRESSTRPCPHFALGQRKEDVVNGAESSILSGISPYNYAQVPSIQRIAGGRWDRRTMKRKKSRCHAGGGVVSELRTIGRIRTSRSPLTLMISFWIGALCVVEILEGRTVGEFYRRLGVRSSRAVRLVSLGIVTLATVQHDLL